MFLGPLYVLLGEVSVQVLCPFFLIGFFGFLEWSRVSSLYILEIKPLSKVSLANMFSHIVGSLFILMLFYLAMQKLFILMKSYVIIPSFMSLALGNILIKIQINKQQVLVRMYGKGHPEALLVRMQTGVATVDNRMEFPQKMKNATAF